jgi:hypothetical protein
VTTEGGPLVERATARITAVLERDWPLAPHARPALLADVLVRLAISAAALPGLDGRAVAALLGPYARAALR